MSDVAKPRWWSRAWVWWTLLALILYPLSMGPLVRMGLPAKLWHPLVMLAGVWPAFGDLMATYLEWWQVSFGAPFE